MLSWGGHFDVLIALIRQTITCYRLASSAFISRRENPVAFHKPLFFDLTPAGARHVDGDLRKRCLPPTASGGEVVPVS